MGGLPRDLPPALKYRPLDLEKAMTIPEAKTISAFNSPLETGIRSLFILSVDVEFSYDLQQLLAFDHFVVHTGDFKNAPKSLHPSDPSRNGELVIRRDLVEQGLRLMESKGLVRRVASDKGFVFRAEEFASVMVENFTSPYLTMLRERSHWVVGNYIAFGDELFSKVFDQVFDRWASEFQFKQISTSGQA